MAKVIIIGASSGMGKALAEVFAGNGYEVGLVARRLELLQELQQQLPVKTYSKALDLSLPDEATLQVKQLIKEMGGVDIFIINSGVCMNNPELDWKKDENTIAVNVAGFTAMANVALSYFLQNKTGHLVGISSVSALRGESYSPAYSASKAYVSMYLEGIRYRMRHENQSIVVTDVKPGWVDTAMAEGEKTFWVASAKEAANNIYSAIIHKRSHAYITARWRLYAWFAKFAPQWLFERAFKLMEYFH